MMRIRRQQIQKKIKLAIKRNLTAARQIQRVYQM